MKRPQNKTHAVMAQRFEDANSPDDFPTPPWATRALVESVIDDKSRLKDMSCLEPASGRGHMSETLKEYFGEVIPSDAFDYDYGKIRDFLIDKHDDKSFDWVITNPPFRLAEEFVLQARKVARVGVAMLTRTVFIESVGRYENIFKLTPPTKFAQFCERVPMVKGRLDRKASTATGYAWLLWEHSSKINSQITWIPPCRRALEKHSDYDLRSPLNGVLDSMYEPASNGMKTGRLI